MNRINPNINNPSGFNYSNLQTHARNALTLAPSLEGRRGTQYLNGYLFNTGSGNVLFNSGTDKSGGYVPPFSLRAGKLSVEGLKDFSTAVKPENPDEHFKNSLSELKLKSNSDGTFSRKGFIGTYTRAENGGIIFSGGHHASNPNIRFEPQIYLNGQWYRLGSHGGTQRTSAGFGGALSTGGLDSFSSPGLGGGFAASGDNFSSTTSSSLSFDFSSLSSSGDTFSSENVNDSTRTRKTTRKSEMNTERTSRKQNQNAAPKKIEVRWTSDGKNFTDESGNFYMAKRAPNGRVSWYEVMDRDLLNPFQLSRETRGRIHYLVPEGRL